MEQTDAVGSTRIEDAAKLLMSNDFLYETSFFDSVRSCRGVVKMHDI